jgi:hypothetical protein
LILHNGDVLSIQKFRDVLSIQKFGDVLSWGHFVQGMLYPGDVSLHTSKRRTDTGTHSSETDRQRTRDWMRLKWPWHKKRWRFSYKIFIFRDNFSSSREKILCFLITEDDINIFYLIFSVSFPKLQPTIVTSHEGWLE